MKITVYHGTDLKGLKGIIENGFSNDCNCATNCKKYASEYSSPYLISFKYDIKLINNRFISFLQVLYYLLFNKQKLTFIVNNLKIKKYKIKKYGK